MLSPQIVAVGGSPLPVDYLLALTGVADPRVCFLPTAAGDDPASLLRLYELFPPNRCRRSHVRLYGIPTPGAAELLRGQDLIVVGGGNTANMLAVWRVHRIAEVLRHAWEEGIVLAGWSAGAICWFEAGVTDSFRAELDGLECLGWLAGSACPHYDGEEQRRPAYHRLVGDGFPAGLAIDDGVGVRFERTELAEVVTLRSGASAYRVERAGHEVREERLDARLLGS